MQAEIILTLDDGTVHRGIVRFGTSVSAGSEAPTIESPRSGEDLDYSLPIRPFMARYSPGMSGSKKFVLLVAHFAQGQLDVHVSRTDIAEAWAKMVGLLGNKYNDAHPTRAKDAGWVYSPENGKFALRNGWKEILQ